VKEQGVELELGDLRDEIARIDRALVLLVAARLRVAREAIRVRTATGDPVTHRTQEFVVLDRARGWALENGVSPDLVVGVLRRLVEAGKVGTDEDETGLPPLPAQVSCRLGRFSKESRGYPRPILVPTAPASPAGSP